MARPNKRKQHMRELVKERKRNRDRTERSYWRNIRSRSLLEPVLRGCAVAEPHGKIKSRISLTTDVCPCCSVGVEGAGRVSTRAGGWRARNPTRIVPMKQCRSLMPKTRRNGTSISSICCIVQVTALKTRSSGAFRLRQLGIFATANPRLQRPAIGVSAAPHLPISLFDQVCELAAQVPTPVPLRM